VAQIDQHSQQFDSHPSWAVNDRGLILIGAGGHTSACIDVIERHGQYQIAGVVANADQSHSDHLEYEILGTDDDLASLAERYRFALVAVGQIETPDVRMRLYSRAVSAGFQLPVIVAPDAYVSRTAVIGNGTIVMHGCIVNANAKIGQNCIVNTRALIEHDTVVGDSCHISTGAILNGGVSVGAGSFIGSACAVKHGVSIGGRCLVGMGCVVRHDLDDNAKLKGAPDA
jgi:sugar O-acyltransferase (sialic acid O-acetyltransferase NeuD family)